MVGLINSRAQHNKLIAELDKRDELQATIDAWHMANRAAAKDAAAYRDFLTEIGYLVPEPAPFRVESERVDAELIAGAIAGAPSPMLADFSPYRFESQHENA